MNEFEYENFRKNSFNFRKNSAEKFRKFVADNFMKHRLKSQYFHSRLVSSHTTFTDCMMVANLQPAILCSRHSPVIDPSALDISKKLGEKQLDYCNMRHDAEQENFPEFFRNFTFPEKLQP